jgi:hypothetical protein
MGAMRIFLVACGRRHKHSSLLLSLTRAIKGDYDHVELAFVKDDHVIGFWISLSSEYAMYKPRDYKRIHSIYDPVHWYELRGISPREAMIIEERCKNIYESKRYTMSIFKMMMSGFPLHDNDLMMMWLPFVEVMGPADGKNKSDEERFKEYNAKMKGSKTEPAFCGSVCAMALGCPSPDHMTASDVYEYCKVNLCATLVPRPPESEERSTNLSAMPYSFTDEGEFVRYDIV